MIEATEEEELFQMEFGCYFSKVQAPAFLILGP